jgi:hypothetical protein
MSTKSYAPACVAIVAFLLVVTFLIAPTIGNAPQAPQNDTFPISLMVGTTTYGTLIASDTSVYELMDLTASSSSFEFKSTFYPSLGYFIDEIGGLRNANGWYWTLYVNDQMSSLGASNYKLKAGDRILWKYEKK